ncbi:hypothetical protein K435DRAFT_974797 [Dendrothele bispora CBS 962.96]|uniref:DUF7330 domain-containing protein n=1 Tax=Dendrothele bispora (strain CBS 962.96) TaxID=1314807 RepID=A0A4S8KJ88_DENBC|nr:hypothetical protein K435DRAFT_974797 [Dendrothele bispora CBS 962.96]
MIQRTLDAYIVDPNDKSVFMIQTTLAKRHDAEPGGSKDLRNKYKGYTFHYIVVAGEQEIEIPMPKAIDMMWESRWCIHADEKMLFPETMTARDIQCLPRYQAPPDQSFKTPTNSVYISNDNDSIKNTFVIDPEILVPDNLRNPHILNLEKDRGHPQNVMLTTRGEVDVKIHISQDATSPEAMWFDIKSDLDNSIKVHAPPFEVAGPSYKLSASSHRGNLFIFVPRDRTALVAVSVHTWQGCPVIVSKKLSENLNIISEEVGECGVNRLPQENKYVIGSWDDDRKDEIQVLDARRVYLQYNDEDFEKPVFGFWQRFAEGLGLVRYA